VSSHLTALTARRAALQAEVALQRDDARQAYAAIEAGTTKVDRVVSTARKLTPLLLVAGAAAFIAVGPARALSLARRGLTLGLYVGQARRLLR
jgi:DNA-binding XRE family transcriptional regulator